MLRSCGSVGKNRREKEEREREREREMVKGETNLWKRIKRKKNKT